MAVFALVFAALDGNVLQAAIPLQVNHQGVISVNGVPFNGTGQFRFALLNLSSMNAWTNDGSALDTAGTPTLAVSLPVSNGLYSVRLGDAALTNMVGIPPDLFATGIVSLRVWFDDGVNGVRQLLPDQRMSSVPYALMAENAFTATDAINSLPSFFDRFGGNGADGALTTSGTVSLGSIRRQFTNLTVPMSSTLVADGGWAFIGVQGRCTIAGTISADGKGELGGPSAVSPPGGSTTAAGLPGTDAAGGIERNTIGNCASGAGGGGGGILLTGVPGGTGGGGRDLGGVGGTTGAGGSPLNPTRPLVVAGIDALTSGSGTTLTNPAFVLLISFRGAGGGSGAGGLGSAVTGRGGNGGGVIYIECDEFEFTGALTANAEDGQNGVSGGAGGGGGGGGGVILVRARKILTSTGAVTVSGGSGGLGISGATNGGNGVGGFWDIVELP